MMSYGLKLWSNNVEWFPAAVEAHDAGEIDFIELYANPAHPFSPDELSILKGILVTIHAHHRGAFHEFVMDPDALRIWNHTLAVADSFESQRIVLHPGREHTIESFMRNLDLIDDSRILIENMAGLDVDGRPMFAQKIDELVALRARKPICFDFEKAVKAARYQGLDYKAYISEALEKLEPSYFHISGGDSNSPIDEHRDLFDSNIDFAWIKGLLESLSEASIVFETPKSDGIANDLANMHYFRNL